MCVGERALIFGGSGKAEPKSSAGTEPASDSRTKNPNPIGTLPYAEEDDANGIPWPSRRVGRSVVDGGGNGDDDGDDY